MNVSVAGTYHMSEHTQRNLELFQINESISFIKKLKILKCRKPRMD